MKVEIVDKILVHSPPVNEYTQKWGVYCIPRLWRALDGTLVVRFNGEEDTDFTENMNSAPNLYFTSSDEGKSWQFCEDGAEKYDICVLSGWDSPYLKCSDGVTRAIRFKEKYEKVNGKAEPIKSFENSYNGAILAVYRQADLPKECFNCELLEYTDITKAPKVTPISIDFPERELYAVAAAHDEEGILREVDHHIKPHIFAMPFINCIFEMPDGTLGGLCYGQNPIVSDRYCLEGYFMVSEDKGVTWKKRGLITPNSQDYYYGLVGDGGEMTITVAQNGDLLCVTRTDLSTDHLANNTTCGARLFVSHDNGFTWEGGEEISDESVTPQLRTLKNGVIICAYGRPGVHFKYSCDHGKTWSEPVSIIGKTLKEELAQGKDYMTSKYWDTPSYSNLFAEVLEDDSVLVLYNNQKYDEGDGQNHKAAFIAVLKCVE